MKMKMKISTLGVVVGALFASACCWLPLLLIALGASTLGFAAFFVAARPWFLGGTALLLIWAVVLSMRSKASPNGEDCCKEESAPRSVFKRMPWVLILVAGSAIYLPGILLAGGSTQERVEVGEQSWLLTLPASTDLNPIEESLRSAIPGLQVQESSRVEGGLLLSMAKDKAESVASLVEKSMESILGENQKSEIQSLRWQTYGVDGLTCDACVIHVENALNGTSGVLSSRVSLKAESASILTLPSFRASSARQAVKQAGYHLQEFVGESAPISAVGVDSDLLSGCCISEE